jgi:hypothetical protein
MLATNAVDRDFLRMRRALTIKLLSERKETVAVCEIVSYLADQGIITSKEVVHDDILGLHNIGLSVSVTDEGYSWSDSINDFVIPIRAATTQSTIEQAKDELRGQITHIPHDYLALLDLAYDSKQNRLFEMKTLQLLTEEFGYEGLHLGGSRRPDGIIYTERCSDNYGVIIDTKAYSRGYSLPINQADEMQRYIQENQRRDEKENPNKWWENFGKDVRKFYFMFVAGRFIGAYQGQIERIARITETNGAAVDIGRLLLLANENKNNAQALSDMQNTLFPAKHQ